MTQEIMSVYKALCELKLLDARINKEINSLRVCASASPTAKKIDGKSISEFETSVRAAYDSVVALTNRRNAIKRAVIIANASTLIDVAGEQMSVAEAIEMKLHSLAYETKLLDKISTMFLCEGAACEDENATLDSRAEKFLLSMFDKKEIKVGSEEIDSMRKNYIEKNTIALVDPLGAEKLIARIKDHIDAFTAEVDSAISVSNATTTISVCY